MTTIIVWDITNDTTVEDIKEIFEKIGVVEDAKIVLRSRVPLLSVWGLTVVDGYQLSEPIRSIEIVMSNRSEAESVCNTYNWALLRGKEIHMGIKEDDDDCDARRSVPISSLNSKDKMPRSTKE